MAREYDRRKSFKTFMHRHGHQFAGLLVLAGFITVGYIGYRESHPKEIGVDEINLETSESNSDTPAYEEMPEGDPTMPTYEETLGIDKLKLSYDIKVDGFDGEMFLYSVYFENPPTDEDISAVEECMDKLPQDDENTYHGDVMVFADEPDKVTVMLDLGNADDEQYITEIPKALDGMKGIKKVVINEGAGEY
ncbi:hypothetical protein [Ruminococcus sp.]|uniref:hypothetical protein n=1 Tax=Ruminococcus sp. TaxID=41978 RepID=UPI00258AE025|nr:hypothetical protein [Ruminococcus sp.]MCR5022490.1 hypothetical protein [Ruminococcus sp.]